MMDLFNHMPVLEGERLRLRRINMHDAQDIYDYSRDEKVAEHVLWSAHRSVFETRSYIRWMVRKYRCGEPASWGIALKSDDRIIGTIGFMWIQDENSCAEVGYSLSRKHWNNGIMTEALKLVIRYGFEEMGLNRIEAIHETTNPASGAVMRKCGMVKEGTMFSKLKNKGRFVDVDMYAILRKDYFASKAALRGR